MSWNNKGLLLLSLGLAVLALHPIHHRLLPIAAVASLPLCYGWGGRGLFFSTLMLIFAIMADNTFWYGGVALSLWISLVVIIWERETLPKPIDMGESTAELEVDDQILGELATLTEQATASQVELRELESLVDNLLGELKSRAVPSGFHIQ